MNKTYKQELTQGELQIDIEQKKYELNFLNKEESDN